MDNWTWRLLVEDKMGRVNKRPQRVVIHEIDANVTEMRVANDYWVLEIVSSAYFFFFFLTQSSSMN